jgi:hypothetical protein
VAFPVINPRYKNPNHEANKEFKSKTEQSIRLGTEQLVAALNEHVRVRQSIPHGEPPSIPTIVEAAN